MVDPGILILIGTLTGALIGGLTGIVGQIIGNYMDYKNKLKYMEKEAFLKKKIEYFERISQLIQNESREYFKLIKEILTNPQGNYLEKFIKLREEFEYELDMSKLDIFDSPRIFESLNEYYDLQKELEKKIKKNKRASLIEIQRGLMGKRREISEEIIKEIRTLK